MKLKCNQKPKLYDFNSYFIFTDLKVNRDKGRLKDLQKVLKRANLTSDVPSIQGLPSHQSLGIQLADFLTGLVTSKFNKEITGETKKELIDYVEQIHLKGKISPTPKSIEKFNVFKINLKGGW